MSLGSMTLLSRAWPHFKLVFGIVRCLMQLVQWWLILESSWEIRITNWGKNYDFRKEKSVIFSFLLPDSNWTFVHFYWQNCIFKKSFFYLLMKENDSKWLPGCEREKNSLTFLSLRCPHSFQHYPSEERIEKPLRCLAIVWKVPNLGIPSWHILSDIGHFLLTYLLSRGILLLVWLV